MLSAIQKNSNGAAQFLDDREAAKTVGLHVEPIETAHVAGPDQAKLAEATD
jgi:hypothetical protein